MHFGCPAGHQSPAHRRAYGSAVCRRLLATGRACPIGSSPRNVGWPTAGAISVHTP
jgi:hypothetical protein